MIAAGPGQAGEVEVGHADRDGPGRREGVVLAVLRRALAASWVWQAIPARLFDR